MSSLDVIGMTGYCVTDYMPPESLLSKGFDVVVIIWIFATLILFIYWLINKIKNDTHPT